jgi:hypothetical protein
MIIKELLMQEVHDYFNSITKGEEESKIIKRLIEEYFNKSDIVFEKVQEKYKIKENQTHIYRERDKYMLKENKCLARIWNCGMGGQCSNKGINDGFCKKHSEPKTGPGKYEWWMGTVDKPRPERPINHKGKIHEWLN